MKISVCIPVYNEAGIIEKTAKTLSDYMSENFDDYEIIFSDDGSRDGSSELIKALSLPYVRVVGYKENRGKGCAVRTAMLAAEGDFIMFTDADLAYGTEVIKTFADVFEKEKCDVLIGSRSKSPNGYKNYTFLRKTASKAYLNFLNIVGGLKLSDSQTGCKGFSKESAKKIFEICETDGFAFDFEALMLAKKFGFSISEIPVEVKNHRASKIRLLRDSIKMVKDIRKIKKRIKKTV